MSVPSLQTNNSSFDYDGFGSELGRFDGRFGAVRFDDFDELRSLTTEAHAVQLDARAFAAAFVYPSSMFPALSPVDLRLAAGSAAVDVGIELANVNDGFVGRAPDLGAYEFGFAPPPYGPRAGVAAECGNGVVESGEACDDANTVSGDGCSDSCQIETGADAGRADAVAVDGGAIDGPALEDASATNDAGDRDGSGSQDASLGSSVSGVSDGDGNADCGCRTSDGTSFAWLSLALLALVWRRLRL